MRRFMATAVAATAAMLWSGGVALACGGLIGPNGAVNLLRTTTFAGYSDGVEHYITAFSFAGGGGAFGSIVPLPGVPSNVERGGAWTLQRLVRETNPVLDSLRVRGLVFSADAPLSAEELFKTRIDALDVTVLKGGGAAVGSWAKEHGFRLPPDAPEVLDFYAKRSPIFLAAVFDADAAAQRGQRIGDGTPVHITIPTPNPWVPLRILGLGKQSGERVEAEVFLLTSRAPSLLPSPAGRSLFLDHSAPARKALLDDLRADRGMEWVPPSGWLTKLRIDAAAGDLTYDLAIDASGQDSPSRVAAGFDPMAVTAEPPTLPRSAPALAAYLLALLGILGAATRLLRRASRPLG